MREAELYPVVKRHFENLGYAVYAEVPAPHGGYVDLLAVREPVTVAVELKPRFSRGAVRQAGRNRRYVWESYVAVPQGARILPARRAALKRHRAGLLLVKVAPGGSSRQPAELDCGVRVEIAARRQSPACTVREAFGPHLRGQLALVYRAARGWVPTRERVSVFKLLVQNIKASLEAGGGFANTDQILADTLAWNYFRNPRGGLRWVLEHRFTTLGPDLWALKAGSGGRAPRKSRRPVDYALPLDSLVRTHLPNTYVCLPAATILPLPGDYLSLLKDGRPLRRARVVSAGVHPILETPQRELRAGPAVFFPWRCPREVELPGETLVLRLIPLKTGRDKATASGECAGGAAPEAEKNCRRNPVEAGYNKRAR